MSLTLLIVLITAAVAGVGFWFYNRRQINSLTETIEDKNAVISSFREHLTTPIEESTPTHSVEQTFPMKFNPAESEVVIDLRDQKKKKQRYGNRPKKNSSNQSNQSEKQTSRKNSEKNDSKKPRKKNKPQQ